MLLSTVCAKCAHSVKHLVTSGDRRDLRNAARTESLTGENQSTTKLSCCFGSKMPQVQILSPRLIEKPVTDCITRRLPRAVFLCPAKACAQNARIASMQSLVLRTTF